MLSLQEPDKSPWFKCSKLGKDGKPIVKAMLRVIRDGDIVLIWGGMHEKTHDDVSGAIAEGKVDGQCKVKQFVLVYEEAACRRTRCRGTGQALNFEILWLITKGFDLYNIKKKKRDPGGGTTYSQTYIGLTWPRPSQLHQISASDKTKVYDGKTIDTQRLSLSPS